MESISNHATFRKRSMAFGIDFIAIVILQLTLGSLTLALYRFACTQYGVESDYEIELFMSQFCGGFFFLSYFTITVGLFGNTIGKEIMALRIVDEFNQPLTFPKAYWRSLSYLLSSWTYMIGFCLPLLRSDNKALHDLVCGTQVLMKTKTDLPLFEAATQIEPLKTPSEEILEKQKTAA